MTRQEGRRAGELADALLARHLQASWPESTRSIPSWFPDRAPARHEDSLRVVAVVGAGASHPMESIADELADQLEEELDPNSDDRKVELDRLENVFGLDPNHFETRLTAICRTPEAERKVRERISERYRHRHPSLLTYELLAHLLHHRFLDAIVSFNFDELLDQAIEDELGPNEYTRVVTERDCRPEVPTGTPLYVKMHGTASEPDSLRFTRERYYWTPKSIVELVEREFDVEHLVLVNVGFRLASFDFQYLLRKPNQLRIYHLDPRPLATEVEGEIETQRQRERERQKVQRPATYDEAEVFDFSQHDPKDKREADESFLPTLMGQVIDALKKRCEADDSGPAAWRSTLRHKAVVEILQSAPIETPEQYAAYLRRRTILELAFAAARGRGVLAIASMVDDRCGRYYDLYKREAGEDADTWDKVCRASGLKESKQWANTYVLAKDLRKTIRNDNPKDTHQIRPSNPRELAKYVMQSMNASSREAELTELLEDTIGFLQKETEIEVHARDDRVCSKIFVNPVTLGTFSALRGWTRHLLESTPEYNEILAITETGDWLLQPGMLGPFKEHWKVNRTAGKRPIKFLVAFDQNLKGAERLITRKHLPWGRHNRHMTIVCKDGQPRAAIYFVRRLRAPTVTPVFLSDQVDLRRIKKAFDELWDQAMKYECSGEFPGKRSC